ncbi:hypothetical protein K435DRAFT_880789 [Dendrothele bispora CBS 962.96]|uniref:Uncharacterized protein n=1 Tax=Dendrothele bispora (strain CBS 962.96) TaxID=1314807 RepID=A0A4S8KJ84_DENBC|nr:hypothetical protein K435DRAFT_880789 [Dendrothele bispora CBS 962.96]
MSVPEEPSKRFIATFNNQQSRYDTGYPKEKFNTEPFQILENISLKGQARFSEDPETKGRKKTGNNKCVLIGPENASLIDLVSNELKLITHRKIATKDMEKDCCRLTEACNRQLSGAIIIYPQVAV